MITTEQNTPRQIQRLRAQRQLYAKAKTILGIEAALGGPIAVATTILVANVPSMKGICALWGIGVTLCQLFWLSPWQKRIRDKAARTQELFDCDVLSLPWNSLKAGKAPDPELIKEQSDAYEKHAARMPLLENWYPTCVDTIPPHIARLACQRANCQWDAKQRRYYAVIVISIVVLTFAAMLSIALVNKLTVADLVLTVLAPLAPLFTLGLKQWQEQNNAATRIERLQGHAETLWQEALSSPPGPTADAKSRELQDEILENRRSGPLIFDFIFKRLRQRYEGQMIFGAEELVWQAKKALRMT